MADFLDTPSFNFGIEDTREMGNQELINGLYETESSTENPDKVSPLEDDKKDGGKKDPPKPKSKPAPKKEDEKEEEKKEPKEPANKFLFDFMRSEEGNEDEEDDSNLKDETEDNKGEDDNEDNDNKGEDENENGESNTPFNALAKELFSLGVFTTDDEENEEEITTPEQLLERFNLEKSKGANLMLSNFLSRFGEDYQNAFDAIFVKGVNPKDYFRVYNNIVKFSELNLEEEANQVLVVRQMLEDQGYEEDEITTEIERLKNYGDLQPVSTKYHKVLVRKEASKFQELEANAKKENEEKARVKNQYIQNVNTILQEKVKAKEFDGIPINPKLATELQDFLLVDKWKTSSGETLTDFDRAILELKRPENHATKVKVALLLKIMEKDPTLSTIQKRAVTKGTNALFGEVARQISKSKTGNSDKFKPSW